MILNAAHCTLALIDLQARLMPAIHDGEAVVANARRLAEGAQLLGVAVVATEQNPKGLGGTVPGLLKPEWPLITKLTFDSCGTPAFPAALPATRDWVVLSGCEAHVCVLQTALGLLALSKKVAVVRDAVGSRTAANRKAALARLSAAGAVLVTTEMVLFEWLGSSENPQFRAVLPLIK